MTDISHSPDQPSPILLLQAGEDHSGEKRGLGISLLAFKVLPQAGSDVFIIENTFHSKGGPAKHMHYEQDEWFYCLEGEFLFEVGQERLTLHPGDSLLAPRNIPHVWAFTGDAQGRILIAFLPSGKMEAFFREVTKENAMPIQDPALWHTHGMKLMGPPMGIPSG